MLDIFKRLTELAEHGTPHVLVSMIHSRGEAPADIGSKAIITSEGLNLGTVGGGKVELRAIQKAKEFLSLQKKHTETFVWNLQKDIGMTCGGEVTFLFEVFVPAQWEIAVFGAGHVSQSLVRLLQTLSCQITCIDSRKEWVEKLTPSSNLKAVHAETPALLVQSFSEQTYFVVMTQGHAFDVPILKEIFTHFPNCAYVGVIGSKIKGDRIKRELVEAGISQSLLEKLRCPIGLAIGTNATSEIAISIAAELLKVRDLGSQPEENKRHS